MAQQRAAAPGSVAGPEVVKLGGSLYRSPVVGAWLTLLASPAPGGRLIVPGGGFFADRVRERQRAEGFDDPTAHRLALAAMDRAAVWLAARCPALRVVASLSEVDALAAEGRAGVFTPAAEAAGEQDLPATWALTSDSIALWCAQRLGARRLVLVKSCPPPVADASPASLAAHGYIDPKFPDLFASAPLTLAFVDGRTVCRLP